MSVNLPNLYATPSDIYDFLGVEGVQLRLDDDNQATGQVIQTTAASAQGAISVPVLALRSPLLPGTQLAFQGAGMPSVLTVTLQATAGLGATSLPVLPLALPLNQLAQAFDSGVNIATAARLIKACQYGTTQVKLYCATKYDDSELVQSWSVNRWATALGSRWLSRRRGQSAPAGVEEEAKLALEEMRQVRVGMLYIEDIGTRTASWPWISNITIDIAYDYARARVETPLSEGTPTQYPQRIDWNSALLLEF